MTISLDDVTALEALETRLIALLPEPYRDSYEDVRPVSMGSAGLKYDAEGRVAWNEIWATFCDLAMAGGPPHRGQLLEPAPAEDAAAADRCARVVAEICRGIAMVTGLGAEPAPPHGVRVRCRGFGMAAWLARAVVMENVLARQEDAWLYLPAGPDFRLEKEIKNVVTTMAKTCHYWTEHIPPERQAAIGRMLAETPLLAPAGADGAGPTLVEAIAGRMRGVTGRAVFAHRYPGWIGVECPDVRAAVWLMRALVTADVLSRREGVVLFLPVNPDADPDGRRLTGAFTHLHRLAAVKHIL